MSLPIQENDFFISEAIYFLELLHEADATSLANEVLTELKQSYPNKHFDLIQYQKLNLIYLVNSENLYQDQDTIFLLTGMIKNVKELKELLKKNSSFSLNEINDMELAYVIFNLSLIYKDQFPNLINGLFHIIIFNKHDNSVRIINDRFGICFVYYHDNKQRFLSSSSLDLLMSTGIERVLSLDALDDYLSYRISQPPNTMYVDVFKLPQAFSLISSSELCYETYLDLDLNLDNSFDEKLFIDEFRNHFKRSTLDSFKMQSPAFTLSGGVDSSIIALLASEHTSIDTFNLSVGRNNYIDEKVSKEISFNLNTNHEIVHLRPKDISNDNFFEMCIDIIEEPTVNSFPNEILLNQRIAKDYRATVYGSMAAVAYFEGYFWKEALKDNKKLFSPIYKAFLELFEKINIFHGNMHIFKKAILRIIIFLRLRAYNKDEKIEDANRLFKNFLKRHLYSNQSLKRFLTKEKASKLFYKLATKSEVNKAMYTEHFCQSIARTSLFNSMHQKMHHFFYYPYLDKSFADFNLLVPSKLKLEKEIAKKAFHEEALKASFNRPRQGMSLAYEWLGNDLLSWTEKILLETPHPIDDFFNQSTIKFMLRTHAKEKYDFGVYLWSLVVLKKWLILKKVSIKE